MRWTSTDTLVGERNLDLKRPVIFWGLDSLSQRIITGLGERLEVSGTQGNGIHIFRPTENPTDEFRQFLAKVEAAAKSSNLQPEPVVDILTASYLPESDLHLEQLTTLSELLKSSLSGSQSIQCVVFVPPSNATATELLQAYRFFLRLEDILGNEPFLNIVFVNQLPLDLYETSKTSTDEMLQNDEIQELLYRQLLDAELQMHIMGTGYQAIENRNNIKGKKCGYSTMGSYRLIYNAPACFHYLTARFQHDCFYHGLWDLEGVEDEDLIKIQAVVDGAMGNYLNTLTGSLPPPPRLSAEHRYISTGTEEPPEGSQTFPKELARVMGEIDTATESARDSLDDCITKNLMEFLPTSPKYLAGATLLLRAFNGARLLPDLPNDEKSPSGILQFDDRFCLLPLHQSLDRWFGSHWPAALIQNPLPPRKEKDTWATWVRKSLKLLHETPPELTAGGRCLITFYSKLMTVGLNYFDRSASGPLRSPSTLTHGLTSELQNAEDVLRECVQQKPGPTNTGDSSHGGSQESVPLVPTVFDKTVGIPGKKGGTGRGPSRIGNRTRGT